MSTTCEDAPTLDPLEEGFFDDPYPQYAELRQRNPIHSVESGVTLYFRFDAARQVLTDRKSTSMDHVRALSLMARRTPKAPPTFPLSLINRDSPDHNRLRRLMAYSLTPRAIGAQFQWMESRVDQLLDEMERAYSESGEPVDLVRAVAFPFPFSVISRILGMPDGDDLQIRDWAHDISSVSDPIVPREQVHRGVVAYESMCEYMTDEVIPWKQEHLGDDLFSRLLVAQGEGSVSWEEMLDNVALLYVAGHETTSGLIGNAVLNLLRHREQLELLRSQPSLMDNTVEELNRYEGSIQFAWRYVIEEMRVDGQILEPGTMAFVCCGSANRDTEHFGADADELNIARSNANDGLSFGAGMHFCLGAHLARREVALVISRLFERFPGLELAAPVTWSHSLTFRRLLSLPVALA